MPKQTFAAAAEGMPKSRSELFANIMGEGLICDKVVRKLSQVTARQLEEMHGVPFRVDIDHDVGFVLIRRTD